jgi:hypothetical protein
MLFQTITHCRKIQGISGFGVIRNDRGNRRGEGVVIFVKIQFLLRYGAVRSFFIWGAESEGRRPEEIFKFRVSEIPFPGLWARFDSILMVREQCFSMPKFTI